MDVVWDGVRVEVLVETPIEVEEIVEDKDGVPDDAVGFVVWTVFSVTLVAWVEVWVRDVKLDVSLAVTAEVTRLFGVDGIPVEVRMEVL